MACSNFSFINSHREGTKAELNVFLNRVSTFTFICAPFMLKMEKYIVLYVLKMYILNEHYCYCHHTYLGVLEAQSVRMWAGQRGPGSRLDQV